MCGPRRHIEAWGEKLVNGGGVILAVDGIPLPTGPGPNRARSGVGTALVGAFH
jgi:hypothetical protein